MRGLSKIFLVAAVILATLGLFFAVRLPSVREEADLPSKAPELETENSKTQIRLEHFSEFSPVFRFSASVPQEWQAEYVPELTAVNLSNQIFIRYFQANDFLTLQTVNILDRQNDTINSHAAVRYEIEKKPGLPDFAGQPKWRSTRHKVVDLRLGRQNPTYFYVFAKNPELDDKTFEDFLQNIQFHNDPENFVQPLEQAKARITKKPFGIYVTPATSPVQPDRFTGWHTGTDYEILAGEESSEVPVYAVCGGPLRLKRTAGGYGGMAVQDCLLQDEPITVIYGHLDFASITASPDEYLASGAKLGWLGEGFTSETDNARKHLHLSIHKGEDTEIRGYVSSESELVNWLNPEAVLNYWRAARAKWSKYFCRALGFSGCKISWAACSRKRASS